ncbi:MAG: TRAP transporter small permease subunit [Chloroflexota bacterium]
MMRPFVRFARMMDRITEWVGNLAVYLVIITFIVGFLNVVLRYSGRFVGMRLTSNLFIELQWYLYSLIFFLGFAYILKNNINVRVDFWYAEFEEKTKAWIDLVGHLISLIPFCILALIVTYPPVMTSWGRKPDGTFPTWRLWEIWEKSPDPSGLPRAPIKTVILLAFILLLLQGIAELIKLVAVLRDYEDDEVQLATLDAPIRIE